MKSARVRQQAADLISKIAAVMQVCGEEQLLGHLAVVLYEYLGEEYPEGEFAFCVCFVFLVCAND
jgi:splicing factor 3B subunit 1